MKKIIMLSLNDLKNIRRDPMLLFIILGPILLTFLFRFGLPIVDKLLHSHFSFNLLAFKELIMGFIMLLVPFLVGILIGLIILDEKDENLLVYYAVTPITKQGYLYYRLAMPFVLSFLLTIFMWAFIGFIELDVIKLLPVAVVTALEAPLITLAMAVFASNKVEGLAISKGAGVILTIPFIVYFVSSKWVWFGYMVPTFWVSSAFFHSFNSTLLYAMFVIGGIMIHFIYIKLMLVRFQRTVF
ncbi:hypothetical protein [Gracilibacillus saliphilus]|uniref:hypothetical protein n=1 Tax=Gracilibacillus saliphilus TaxID=543890 RepID=UPI0013D87186|nr:hypothetical protein [Gracilibacillus saliphilus]